MPKASDKFSSPTATEKLLADQEKYSIEIDKNKPVNQTNRSINEPVEMLIATIQ